MERIKEKPPQPPDGQSKPAGMPSFDFDKAPFLVLWEITRACDLACRHCRAEAQAEPLPGELSTIECFRLLDNIKVFGQPIVVLTGGDPLKRADILDIIAYGTRISLKMTMTPSGTPLVTRERIKQVKEAGLTRLAISLDGATPETHDAFRGVEGSWKWTMNCIRYAKEFDLPVQINTTFAQYNKDDFQALADVMVDLDISLWSVFFLVPTGRGQADDALTAEENEELFEQLYELSKSAPFDIKTTAAPQYRRLVIQKTTEARRAKAAATGEASLPGADHPKIGSGRAPAGVTDGRGVVFVAYNGDVFPSGFLPVKGGNVRDTFLTDIYRSSSLFKTLRDPEALGGKCGVCEFKKLCGGSRARAYALTGDYTAEDPGCSYVSVAATALDLD